jgi:ABC-type polysaccharide/polyol phosphate transport system ATPase subunit
MCPISPIRSEPPRSPSRRCTGGLQTANAESRTVNREPFTRSAMSDELIRMERINKFFGRVQALNDVSLSVNNNEIVALLGDNGAGKSTLIKILSGALRPTSGKEH